MDSVKLDGAQIYKEVVDLGCNNDGSVGLAIRVSCGYEGFALYKNAQDLSTDSAKAKQALAAMGFHESYGGFLRDGKAIGEKSEIAVKLVSVTPSKADYPIVRLIADGKIASPTNNEYIYGIYASAGYYSCGNESFFKQGCPTPPSAPK